MKFIHTADWQLGKPFARIDDDGKRSLLQQERFEAIGRIGKLAREERVDFVLVAGDLFDSATPTKTVVAAACSAIGSIGVPVFVIPGNHDHGGPGSVWGQEFFQREKEELAPNLRVLLACEPVEIGDAVIFPCPLLRKAESVDTTAWLRSEEALGAASEKSRIVIAHGSVHGFSSESDDEENLSGESNRIDLTRLSGDEIDYVALGDWHGTKQVGDKAWYSGTPELDRFPKGGDYEAGNVLLVETGRGTAPIVSRRRTGEIGWHDFVFDFADDASLAAFSGSLAEILGNRVNRDLLQLRLTGSLGIAASTELERRIEQIESRVLRLKLNNDVSIAPTEEEIQALTRRAADPLISRVATRLLDRLEESGEAAAVARIALRELHAAVSQS